MEALNIKLFFWFHQGAGQQPIWDNLAIFFAEGGPYLLIFALVVCWLLAREQRRPALLEATKAGLLGLFFNQIAGLFFYYPRPYMVGLCTPLVAHSPENSFPSDHATLMLAVAFSLLLRRTWRGVGLVLLAAAMTTAWGRVYSGVHFPLDMAGSLMIAFVSSGILLWQQPRMTLLNGQLVKIYQQLLKPYRR